MKNIFEEAYQKELQAIAAFDAAKNDEEKEKARELHNETFGQIGSLGEFAVHIVVEAVRNFPQMSLHEWVLWAHGLASGIVMLYWWISRG